MGFPYCGPIAYHAACCRRTCRCFRATSNLEAPPAITHPEFFYGFIGVGLAWQAGFLLISRDPVRFRPLMPAAMLEKFIHVAAMTALWSSGRVAGAMMPPVAVDLLLGALFVAAYRRTPAAVIPEARMPQPVRG